MISSSQLNEPETCKHNQFHIIYANDEFIVVNKPYDVPMDGTGYSITVEEWATKYMETHNINNKCDYENEDASSKKPGKKQLKFVHQLDYSTSGVLCLAFNKDMAARLAHCFQMRTCQKFYLAILQGHVPEFEMCESDNVNSTYKHIKWSEFIGEQMIKHKSKNSDLESAVRELEKDKENEEEGIWVIDSRSIIRPMNRENAHGITSYYEKNFVAQHEHNTLSSVCWFSSNVESRVDNGHLMNEQETLESNAMCHEEINLSEILNKEHNALEINLPIGYDNTDTSGFRMTVQRARSDVTSNDDNAYHHNDTGKRSITYLHVLERCYMYNAHSGKLCPVTKVLLEPHTGRRHQLRVHCHALGYPILGDVTYTKGEPTPVNVNNQIAENGQAHRTSQETNNEEEKCEREIRYDNISAMCETDHVNDKCEVQERKSQVAKDDKNTTTTTTITTTTTTTNTSTSSLQKTQDWNRMYLHAWRLCLPCNVNAQWTEQEKRAWRRKRRRETLKLESAAGNAAELNTWTEFIADNSLW